MKMPFQVSTTFFSAAISAWKGKKKIGEKKKRKKKKERKRVTRKFQKNIRREGEKKFDSLK